MGGVDVVVVGVALKEVVVKKRGELKEEGKRREHKKNNRRLFICRQGNERTPKHKKKKI